MKRYRTLIDVTETYEVFVDAQDEEEAADNAYDMTIEEIMNGDLVPGSEVEIQDIVEEVPFKVEE